MSEAAENLFLQDFAATAAGLPGTGASWLDARRARAIKIVRTEGIPNRRIEEWKYSDLRNALDASAEAQTERVSVSSDMFAGISAIRLVIGHGTFDRSLSNIDVLPAGLEVHDLSSLDNSTPTWVSQSLGTLVSERTMGAASLALMAGGIALRVTRDLETPIRLEFLQRSGRNHARVLLVMEAGSSATLLESHAEISGFANIGVEIVMRRGTSLTHIRLAGAAPKGVEVEEVGVSVARDSHYRAHCSQLGSKLSRLGFSVALNGEGAEADLSGASVLSDQLHADITTHIDHASGRTASRQLFKKVAAGHSRAVYQGKITVRPGAIGSDSRQTAKALLLGARAEADLKPELEILADDVKCAHGAAVGALDADSLFYLRSRGIPEAEAKRMLIRGFLEEPIAEIAEEGTRAQVWSFVEKSLARVLGSPS